MNNYHSLITKIANLKCFLSLLFCILAYSSSYANVCAQAEGWDYSIPAIICGVAGFFVFSPRFYIPNILFSLFFGLWFAPCFFRAPGWWQGMTIFYALWIIVVIASTVFSNKTYWTVFVPAILLIASLSIWHDHASSFLLYIIFSSSIILFAIIKKVKKDKKQDSQDRVEQSQTDNNQFIQVRVLTVIILGTIFIGQCYLASSSRLYYDLSGFHIEILDTIDELNQKICAEKSKDPLNLYPSAATVEALKQKVCYPTGKNYSLYIEDPNLDEIKYYISPDRKTYRLVYEGNVFRASSWYLLPSGFPFYESSTGLNTGERMDVLKALYHVYIKKDIKLDRRGIKQKFNIKFL